MDSRNRVAHRAGGALLVLLTVTGLVAACSTSASNSSASGGSNAAINLYYTAPLTGGAAQDGIAGCQGEQLAVANINAAGGISAGPLRGAKLSVSCLDDQGTSTVDASIAARYVSDPNTWALSGFYASGSALAAALVAQRAGLVVIGSNVAANFLTTQVHNVYTVLAKLPPAGAAAAQFCKSYYGADKIAELNPNYSFIQSYQEGAAQAISSGGLKLVYNGTWPDGSVTNWNPYLSKIASSGAQCILLGGYPPEQCQIAYQARQLGLTQPIIDFSDSYTSSSCAKAAGSHYAGLIFGNVLPPTFDSNPLGAKLAAQFQKKYGYAVNFYAVNGYDSVLAVAYAIEAGATSRTQLLTYLGKVNGPGFGGTIAFSNQRIGTRYLTFLQANTDGSLTPVAEYTLLTGNQLVQQVFVTKCAQTVSCQTKLG